MKIEIVGWSSKGFRCPDVQVTLSNDAGNLSSVSLIQMPNGTGKTTTLELLRATLSGDIGPLQRNGLRQLARVNSDISCGEFSVDLRIDGDEFNVRLEVDFSSDSHVFYTTSPKYGGTENEFTLPASARKFFTKEFLDLFLFDAEFQQSIFDTRANAADSAINALCQIYIMEEIQDKANLAWREKAQTDTTKSESGLGTIRKDLEKARKRQVKLKEIRQTAQDFIHENLDNYSKKEADFASIEATMGEFSDKKSDAKYAHDTAKEELKNVEDNFLGFLRNIYFTSEENSNLLDGLYNSLEKNQLPETTSKQFFIDLAQKASECICGRALDEEQKEFILENSKNFLSSDTSGVMNQIKAKIEDYKVQAFDSAALNNYTQSIKDKKRKINVLGEDYERASRLLEEAGGEKLKAIANDAAELKQEIEKRRDIIEVLDAEHDTRKPLKQIDIETVKSLDSVSLLIKELEEREANITNTVDLKRKIDILDQIIKSATSKAQSVIKSELKEKCNDRLKTLLVNDPLKIASIDKSINLQGQDGASAGQQLTVAYTFLMSLLERGGNQFPLIVDSPAGPLDRTVRANVGSLIPEICDQYIAFTINTEHPGFVSSLKENCSNIKFLTLFRKTEGTERFMQSLPNGRFVENDNGVLVDDENYFDNFDISKEE